jgi:hypothetical protein
VPRRDNNVEANNDDNDNDNDNQADNDDNDNDNQADNYDYHDHYNHDDHNHNGTAHPASPGSDISDWALPSDSRVDARNLSFGRFSANCRRQPPGVRAEQSGRCPHS